MSRGDSRTRDGRKTRAPGEFPRRREELRARQRRHDAILATVAYAKSRGSLDEGAWMDLDGFRVLLVPEPSEGWKGTGFILVRTRKFGIRLARVIRETSLELLPSDRDFPMIGRSRDDVVAYVGAIERDGVELGFWDP